MYALQMYAGGVVFWRREAEEDRGSYRGSVMVWRTATPDIILFSRTFVIRELGVGNGKERWEGMDLYGVSILCAAGFWRKQPEEQETLASLYRLLEKTPSEHTPFCFIILKTDRIVVSSENRSAGWCKFKRRAIVWVWILMKGGWGGRKFHDASSILETGP